MQQLKVAATKGKAKKAKYFDCPSTTEYMSYRLDQRIAANSEGTSAASIVAEDHNDVITWQQLEYQLLP